MDFYVKSSPAAATSRLALHLDGAGNRFSHRLLVLLDWVPHEERASTEMLPFQFARRAKGVDSLMYPRRPNVAGHLG